MQTLMGLWEQWTKGRTIETFRSYRNRIYNGVFHPITPGGILDFKSKPLIQQRVGVNAIKVWKYDVVWLPETTILSETEFWWYVKYKTNDLIYAQNIERTLNIIWNNNGNQPNSRLLIWDRHRKNVAGFNMDRYVYTDRVYTFRIYKEHNIKNKGCDITFELS